ncbi:B12-binding domain-containing radical SAM protein [Nocardia sp. NPDC051570]|uniref:B12-binding domain-containing radical SAM protein n=1 Tax=Nocardia sp. NPDC051570 TaxID=3364324 RepID=UPI0037B986E0
MEKNSTARPHHDLIAGAHPDHPLDLVMVNAPLRDYSIRPRVNDFTLPVLGLGYIATYASLRGFNVGVLDAEALGLGIGETTAIVNAARPRWAGFNMLAPTAEISATIAAGLDPTIHVMLGGHQAKAMPTELLTDPRMSRCAALVIGEAETRVAELLDDHRKRAELPGVMWLDPIMRTPVTGGMPGKGHYLAPDIDALPFVDRRYLVQDPHEEAGRIEANVVGARGCPYDCSFCGAAVSANPDVKIRVRKPENIIHEMLALRDEHGVTAFRFVDDLFLGARRVIDTMMTGFSTERIGEWARWDATGRINVLNRASDIALNLLVDNGLREVALGVESGNDAMLAYIDKRITADMAVQAVTRLLERGINVKGYFILGFPGETPPQMDDTENLIHRLWDISDHQPGTFRASVFEFRPYPATPEWHRLMATGRYTPQQLLDYEPVDLTGGGVDAAMLGRDEFNFAVPVRLSDAPPGYVRDKLTYLSRTQWARLAC